MKPLNRWTMFFSGLLRIIRKQDVDFEYLVCDNPMCNHIEYYWRLDHTLIDRPCPKCGINLLEADDYYDYRNMTDRDFLYSLGIMCEDDLQDIDFLDLDIYDQLFERWGHEMPYGTAKARIGDPDQWLYEKCCRVLKYER